MSGDSDPLRILVIEDNPGDFLLVEEYLKEQIRAPEIVQATNFATASRILGSDAGSFDAILLDLTLPDKSGQSLITDIVALASDQPVIILTGYTDVEFSIQSISRGASDYLLKDELNPASLYKSINYCLERRKTLLKLKASEQRYSDLFHFSPQPMWVCECDTLECLDVNTAAIRHYGYTYDEFLSMRLTDVFVEDHQDGSLALAKADTAQQVVARNRKKNGEVIEVDFYSNPIEYKGARCVVILAHDITDRINYIRAIEIRNKKLVDIAWIQSHVVRAPLARMMGLIDLLKNPQIPKAEKDGLIEPILASAQELDTLIRDITKKSSTLDHEV